MPFTTLGWRPVSQNETSRSLALRNNAGAVRQTAREGDTAAGTRAGSADALRRYATAGLRVARANVTRLATPLKVNLALTYWCQYKCQTCNIWRRKPVDELSTAEVLQFIERNRHFSWADLTGGEIFLREDIHELLEAVAETWRDLVVLHFPTNGFLTRKIVDTTTRLATYGVPKLIVTVSLDGDQATNDAVRGIKGGFARQMDTFAALHQLPGVTTVLGMTLSRFNAGQVERTFAACQERYPALRWDDFHVNLAQTSGHYYDNASEASILAPKAQAIADLRDYHRHRSGRWSIESMIERRFAEGLWQYLDTGVTPMPCHALRSSCFIDPWGTVFPCISYTRPLGALRDVGMQLEPLWNAGETKTVQREIWQGECPQCWTACEAYQSILGNLLRRPGAPKPANLADQAASSAVESPSGRRASP